MKLEWLLVVVVMLEGGGENWEAFAFYGRDGNGGDQLLMNCVL